MIKSFDNSLVTKPQNFNKIDQAVFLLYLSKFQCKVSFFVQYIYNMYLRFIYCVFLKPNSNKS